MSTEYIHYGSEHFDREKFIPISNNHCWTKPFGGLWASRVDTEYGWRDWCEKEEFDCCNFSLYFKFRLKPEANILEIHSGEDLEKLPKLISIAGTDFIFPNFEALRDQGYDGVELFLSEDYSGLYWKLYGWDCDSIVIFNPDVIEEIKEES